MKKTLALILSLTAMVALFLVAAPAKAAFDTSPINTSTLGLNYGASIGLGTQDVRTTIASIIRTAMGLLGIVAVCIILIGGFKWMTAGGNEDQVGEAKKWIFSGVIGLAIILSAYALANFVVTQLVTATTTG